MRSKIAAVVGFSILTLFLIWQVWVATVRPDRQGVEHYAPQHAVAEPGQRTPDERIAVYTFWLAVFNALLVGVSAFQGYFLIRADRTARLNAEIARDSLQISQRSYLSLVAQKLDSIVDGVKLKVTLKIINASPTPAIIKYCSSRIVVSKTKPSDYTPFSVENKSSVVPRNGDVIYTLESDKPTTSEERACFYGGKTIIFFIAIVTYCDVFGEIHETAIAMNIDSRGNPFAYTDDERYNYTT